MHPLGTTFYEVGDVRISLTFNAPHRYKIALRSHSAFIFISGRKQIILDTPN